MKTGEIVTEEQPRAMSKKEPRAELE